MEELPEGIDSKFRYVMLVSRRAEQIIRGAQPKLRTKHTKAARIAMEEIDKNAVKWQLTPPAPVIEDDLPIEEE